MKRAIAWNAWWAARPVQPVALADEMVISEPARIQRLVGELTRTGRLLSLQTPDGAVACSRTLQIDAAGRLALRLIEPNPGVPVDAAPTLVNVTASAEVGLLLFTLGPLVREASGRLSCNWPQRLIQMQSRRHFRSKALAGSRHKATLELSGVPGALRLQDVSEEGVGFLLEGAGVAPGSRCAGARLILDREAITVPWVQVVHCRAVNGQAHSVVGAQLLDLAAEDTRRLRRWIAMVQAQRVWSVPLAQV